LPCLFALEKRTTLLIKMSFF